MIIIFFILEGGFTGNQGASDATLNDMNKLNMHWNGKDERWCWKVVYFVDWAPIQYKDDILPV